MSALVELQLRPSANIFGQKPICIDLIEMERNQYANRLIIFTD
jgi:hypothetical protein